jgi:phosphatidylserine/phosphatidylglycerophosphate/cardiolipin synthase-like enzyme
MERHVELDVTLVLNVDLSRKELYGPQAVPAFSRQVWGSQRPCVPEYRGRGCPPKCIVADRERVLITSANFTGPGQERNIELGALIRDERLAERVLAQFRSLIARGYLVALPVGG